MESFTTAIESLMKNHEDFQQKFKQRLVRESSNVINPFKFIAGLLTEGVLNDECDSDDAVDELKEMMVELAIKIASSRGATSVHGMLKAFEGSGNSRLVATLRTWAKEKFGVETDDGESTAEAVLSPATKRLPKHVKGSTELLSTGIKLIDNMTSRLDDDLTAKLEGHLVGKASEIVQALEFRTSLVNQNVVEQTDIQIAAGPEVQEIRLTEKAIKAACSKKAIGSLVLALESSKNERILVETLDWLQTSEVRKKNYPISVKSLAREQKRNATGLFAATSTGLVSLDLQTLEATTLTSENTFAVAVNHKLAKVYWTQGFGNSSIMRSNFDGSNKEVIVPPAGDSISTLAIEETTGNVYFVQSGSHEIRVCNALGQNCAAVISNPSLVNYLRSIALDSVKGFMYWSNRPFSGPGSIVRANLDGSNATIISTGSRNLYGITLDQPSNDVVYWADLEENTIGTVDVNGVNKRTLTKLEGNPRPWGIQVDAHKIYIGNFRGKNIQSVEKDSGAKLTTIFNNTTGGVYHLALRFTPVTQS